MFAFARLREAVTSPVFGLILSVPSRFCTKVTAPPPPETVAHESVETFATGAVALNTCPDVGAVEGRIYEVPPALTGTCKPKYPEVAPESLSVPLTSRFAPGLVVPTPTFPPLVKNITLVPELLRIFQPLAPKLVYIVLSLALGQKKSSMVPPEFLAWKVLLLSIKKSLLPAI